MTTEIITALNFLCAGMIFRIGIMRLREAPLWLTCLNFFLCGLNLAVGIHGIKGIVP